MRRSATIARLSGVVVASWLVLAVWLASSYALYLRHGNAAGDLSSALAGSALFVVGWTLMITAMMLPSAVKLLRLFELVVARRDDGGRLTALLVTGFIGVWTTVGLAFQGFDSQVHAAVDANGWLTDHAQVVGAGALLAAGGFQFSALKQRCLTACRNPRSFIFAHWHGARPGRDAVRIGASYGVSCAGCCWALMLVLFALGMSSVVWMFTMGAYMAVEKNTAFGERLSRPVGAALLAAGVLVAIGT